MLIHIVPSGADKTLCGLDSDKANNGIVFSSLGMVCNCRECLAIADKIIKDKIGGN